MKRILSVLVCALLTAAAAQAQGPRLGIKAGANYTDFSGDDSDAWEGKFGFHAGLFASFPITEDFLSLRPELLFSTKGAKIESTDDDKVKLGFIDVPVLAQINAGPLYFEAGPSFSVRVSEKRKIGDSTVDDQLDGLKRSAVGYAAGIGLVSTPLGLSAGVRYSGDFTKIYDSSSGGPELRNSGLLLTLGYMFPSR